MDLLEASKVPPQRRKKPKLEGLFVLEAVMGSDTLEKQQRRQTRTQRLTILSTIVLFGFVMLLCYGLYVYVFIPVADIVNPLEDGTARQPKIPEEKRDQYKHLQKTIQVKNVYDFTVSLFHENTEEYGEHSLIGDYLDDVGKGATVSLQSLPGDVIFATEVNGIRRLEEFEVGTQRSDIYIVGSTNYASSIFDPSVDVEKIKKDINMEMEKVRNELGKLAEKSKNRISVQERLQRASEGAGSVNPDLKFSNQVFDRDLSHLHSDGKKEE